MLFVLYFFHRANFQILELGCLKYFQEKHILYGLIADVFKTLKPEFYVHVT
jgi:hypothetical protein